MKIFQDLEEWQAYRSQLEPDLSLGFVPTMGNLHQGHASLFEHSRKNNDCTVASLFVNPTQFNHTADFTHYPRTLEADLALMEEAGVTYCLLPDEASIYKDNFRFQVQDRESDPKMEALYRPGHFTGVLTVILKLLNLVKPHRAYFGEKDYQQYLLIQNMAEAFFINTDIIACKTVREKSGLAFSSRNSRLNQKQRQKAEQFATLFHQQKTCNDIKTDLFNADIHVEYLEEHFNRRFAAVCIDDIRLIDNYPIS